MQKSMTAIAHGNAQRVCRIPTDEQYTLITYTTVSELPKITDAHNPAKLSAPTLERSDVYAAVEALPEKGRVISNGKSSDGIPMRSAIGARMRESISTVPDALSMATATINAVKVGNKRTAVPSPSIAPSAKE